MLSSARAPLVARFLSEVGRDGVCQLSGFNWGPAAGFPFLPRVRSGRVILSLARWRLAAEALPTSTADDPAAFEAALDGWRKRWDAPSRLAIVSGDHRLPLDLTRAADVDELRRVVRRSRAATVLTEVFPDPDEVWVTDEAGRRFVAELVVPLVRRATAREPSPAAACHRAGRDQRPTSARPGATGCSSSSTPGARWRTTFSPVPSTTSSRRPRVEASGPSSSATATRRATSACVFGGSPSGWSASCSRW
jgi:hypothetical protein